jgi:microcystin-dependent protein
MSELPGVLAVAADNTAGVFELSANTLAVLFFALGRIEDLDYWKDYADEQLSTADIDEIERLVGVATYEVMNAVSTREVGEMIMWPLNAIPAKWLVCNGQAVSRADYTELFALLGTFYGSGNGSTTFNLPDFSDRSPMGKGSAQPNIGAKTGNFSHTLTEAELAGHSHGITQTPHTHGPVSPATVFVGRHAGGNTDWIRATAGATFDQMVATAGANANVTVDTTGLSQPHSILHPVTITNVLIYAGA